MPTIPSPTETSAPEQAMPKTLDVVALVLLIVGGLNWGLVGLFGIDAVAALFGNMTLFSRIVYVLVGVAALYGFVTVSRIIGRRAV